MLEDTINLSFFIFQLKIKLNCKLCCNLILTILNFTGAQNSNSAAASKDATLDELLKAAGNKLNYILLLVANFRKNDKFLLL